MPSLKIHKKWSEKICGFYSREIDRLIDEPSRHDAGRYDKEIFREQISYVESKYGTKGVCCYLLHHLLDMLADEFLSIRSKRHVVDLKDAENALKWILPENVRNSKSEVQWNRLKLKLKSYLENVEDLTELESDLKGRKEIAAAISKRTSLELRLIWDTLPPCISLDSHDFAFIYQDAQRGVFNRIREIRRGRVQNYKTTGEIIDRILLDIMRNYIARKDKHGKCTSPERCTAIMKLKFEELSGKRCYQKRE